MLPQRFMAAVAALLWVTASVCSAVPARPNIIVIMSDDAGFADFGAYGGVATTPHIDRLAAEGMRFTRSFNNARCMPTRLSMLTGLPPQLADTSLFNRIKPTGVTLAEVLREAGYATYMVGKWHLGDGNNATENPKATPFGRGFDRFYGIWDGAAQPRKSSLLDPAKGNGSVRIIENDTPLPWDRVPEDYYVTFTWNQKAIEMIQATPPDQPFFLFLSHTAPHWPIDPFPSYVAAYKDRFNAGWDVLRAQILQNQIALGLFPEGTPLAPRPPDFTAWDEATTTAKNKFRSDCEKYYASITEMDDAIGQLRAALEAAGRADNTLIIFLSDNGADNVMGGRERGMLSNTPFNGFKLTYFEGGVATPFIVWWPGVVPGNSINRDHEIRMEDFMPTLLEVSGGAYPRRYRGNDIFPHHGRSFLAAMQGPGQPSGLRPYFWDHDAQRGVWADPYKAVFVDMRHPVPAGLYPPETDGWHLYKLDANRTLNETLDLAANEPDKLAELVQGWRNWATSVGWTQAGRWTTPHPSDGAFVGSGPGSTNRAKPSTYQRYSPRLYGATDRSPVQVFCFDQPLRGPRGVRFQAVSPSTAAFRLRVYGSNTPPPASASADGPAPGVLLLDLDLGGRAFDWATFEEWVDFGPDGYRYATLFVVAGDENQEVAATSIRTASYDAWARLHFTAQELANSAISGPGASLAGDATPNFFKYLFNLHPRAAGARPATRAAVRNGAFEMTIPVLPGALDVMSASWRSSTNLSQWSAAIPSWFGCVEAPDISDPGSELLRVQLPVATEAGRLFFQLRATPRL